MAVATALLAAQANFSARAIADTSSSDGASGNHENQLRWLPYRPDTTDTQSKAKAEEKTSQCQDCKHGECKKSECKNEQCGCSDCNCADCKCSDGNCKCSECNHSDSSTHGKQHVHYAAAETAAPHSKVRLASNDEADSAPALNDPFEEVQAQSGYQRPVAITTEDDNSVQLHEAPPMRAPRLSNQAPAELQNSDSYTPSRELPGKSVKVYQPSSPTPGPESYQPETLPEMENTRRALQNPAEDCRAAYDKLAKNTLDKMSIDIKVTGQPGNDLPYECSLTTDQFSPRCWELTTYTWKASALCHKPLYFEDEALERYGHSHGWVCEDLASCAHFFGDVALLPYYVGVETPCECIYDLGVYRVGDCSPYLIDPFPLSLRGCCTAAVGYGAVVALLP